MDGTFGQEGSTSGHDLINTPIKRSGWINLYPSRAELSTFSVHATREEADKWALEYRIACLRVEFVEGEGIA